MSKRSIVTASETEFHTDVSEEIDVDFNDKLNWLLLFRKRDDEIHFRHFKKQSGTKFSMVIAVVFFTFVSFYYKLRATEQFPNVLSYLNFGFALFAPVCLGWLMLALESKTIREKITWFRVLHREYESLVHSSWIFASCISQVIALFTGTYNGPCNSTSDFFVVNCLQDDSELSVELLVFTVSLPLILSFVAKAAEWKVVLGAWLLTNIGCITAIVWTDASNVVAAYIVTLFISTMILYENQRQNLFIFLLAMKQTQLLDEKVRNTDDSYVMEMKQMIGNVAHDLKTPLSAFTSGAEYASSVAKEITELLFKEEFSKDYVADSMNSILESLSNMKNINNFMLMTVNRCIDYTKAATGVKLVPRLDTIHLLETVSLPLYCMKGIQSRMTIVLMPIPDNVCKHIITDKQWLQENVLCLLSNAVKYSSEGSITVRISLIEASRMKGKSKSKKIRSSSSNSICSTDTCDCTEIDNQLSSSQGPSARILWHEEKSDCEDSCVETIGEHSVTSPLRNPTTNCKFTASFPSSYPESKPAKASIRTVPMLLIEVEDTGIGVKDEMMKNLFKPFKQAMSMAGGTGLGLFSLAQRVEALKGEYGVTCRCDGQQGSRFWFSIPYRPDLQQSQSNTRSSICTYPSQVHPLPAEAANTYGIKDGMTYVQGPTSSARNLLSSEPSLSVISIESDKTEDRFDDNPLTCTTVDYSYSHSSEVKIPGKPMRILLVDDSPAVLKMTELMLKRHGHRVTTVENGAIALNLVSEITGSHSAESFDVILMDLQMPVMDGLEATKRIRSLESIFEDQSHGRNHIADILERDFVKSFGSTPFEIVPVESRSEDDDDGFGYVRVASVARRRCSVISSLGRFSSSSRTIVESAVEVRMMEGLRHQCIIGLSANSDTGTMEEAFHAGIDAFMPKPFTMATFYETYRQIVALEHK